MAGTSPAMTPERCFGTIGIRACSEQRKDHRLGVLEKVSLEISVVLGTASMPVHQVLRLGRGAIIELESTEDDEVKILANNMPIAAGQVVVNGNRIAVEVKKMLPRAPDMRDS
jgi:flagellar motor switch protein FliN/FliY